MQIRRHFRRSNDGEVTRVEATGGGSLRELAEASGLSLATVHQIETGRTSPGLGTLQSLATALGAPSEHSLADAETLLTDLGALDHQGRITAGGRKMLAFPVHPLEVMIGKILPYIMVG